MENLYSGLRSIGMEKMKLFECSWKNSIHRFLLRCAVVRIVHPSGISVIQSVSLYTRTSYRLQQIFILRVDECASLNRSFTSLTRDDCFLSYFFTYLRIISNGNLGLHFLSALFFLRGKSHAHVIYRQTN